MSVMHLWMKYFFHHTPRYFVIEKCSNHKLLNLTQKVEGPLCTRMSACLKASLFETSF